MYICCMLRLFSQTNLLNIALIPGLIAAYILMHYFAIENGVVMFEFTEKVNLGAWGIKPLSEIWNLSLTIGFIILNVILICWVFNRHNFFEKNTLLPGFIYLITLSLTREFYIFDGAIVMHTFFIIAVNALFKVTFNEMNYSAVFNMGFVLGFGAIFFPEFYFTLPFFYLLILVFKSFKIREFTLFISGWLIPQFYLAFYLYYYNQLSYETVQNWFFINDLMASSYFINVIVLLVVSVITFMSMSVIKKKASLQLTKLMNALIVILLLTSILIFFTYFFLKRSEIIHFITLPISFLFATALLKAKNNFLYVMTFYLVLVFSFIKFFFN